MNQYTYRAEWWPEHGEYVSQCIELPWLSRRAPTLQEATAAVERAVNEFIAERKADGEEAPALHARLVIEAAEQNVSMNQWVVQKLSGRLDRPLGGLFDFD
jgi:hypothetical protein